jgi:hypothetical protein
MFIHIVCYKHKHICMYNSDKVQYVIKCYAEDVAVCCKISVLFRCTQIFSVVFIRFRILYQYPTKRKVICKTPLFLRQLASSVLFYSQKSLKIYFQFRKWLSRLAVSTV